MTTAERYNLADNGIHTPDTAESWQESHLLVWYDAKAGMGGFHRLGHEPNKNRASSLLGVVTASGLRFRRMQDELPLTPEHRTSQVHAAGPHHRVVTGAQLRLEVDEPEVQMSLLIEDYHPIYKWFSATNPTGAAGSERKLASDHYEVGGRVSGSVVLEGRSYEIDGSIVRDHSWGSRDWKLLLAHRWVFANFGPGLVIAYIDLVFNGGVRIQNGLIFTDNGVEPIRDGDVVLMMEADGFSYRGADLRVTGTDGAEHAFTAAAVDSVAVGSHGMAFAEAFCTAEYDGREGFVLVEASNNARAGQEPIQLALRAATDDGLSERAL